MAALPETCHTLSAQPLGGQEAEVASLVLGTCQSVTDNQKWVGAVGRQHLAESDYGWSSDDRHMSPGNENRWCKRDAGHALLVFTRHLSKTRELFGSRFGNTETSET